MIYRLVLLPNAEQDLEAHIKAGNLILIKKIYTLFEELKEHPQTGTGKPKPLKYEQTGLWSRRINDKHRMLYKIENETIIVFILSLWGHYGDK